jgi:hypothetical protein
MSMLVLLSALLAGCAAENSCLSYVEAAAACTEEAGGDAAAYDEASVCGEWTAAQESAYGAWYSCQADAWEAADCSSADGVNEAAIEAAACPAA